jgi:hypothetical protein
MVDVFELDQITIIVSGNKLADIDCRHLISRSELDPLTAKDSSSTKEARDLARKQGEKVLKDAKQAIASKYPDGAIFAHAVQSAGRALEAASKGHTFDIIFMDAYSLLLLQLGKSKTLRQGSDKRAATLHLELQNSTHTKRTPGHRTASTATLPELPVMLST